MGKILIVEDNPDLASLLASVLGERGHRATVFGNGKDALKALETTAFNAALVDLLLPDIRGMEVVHQLTQKGIPSIAMSGVFRGDRFAQEATSEHGAKAFFEKPFDLAAVLSTLEELVGPSSANPPPVEDQLQLDEAVDVDPADRATEDQALQAALGALALERTELQRRAEHQDLPFSGRNVWQQSTPAPPAAPRAETKLGPGAGTLMGTSVPRLLGAVHQGRTTGELRLHRGQVIKVVCLSVGRPIYAASNVASERFGRFAVARGAVAAEELPHVQDLATAEGLRTGEAMVRLGLISPEARLTLLNEQAQQIVWSTFDWPDGQYQLQLRSVTRPQLVSLNLSVPALILEGLRRFPLMRLRARLGFADPLMPTGDPIFELHELGLDGSQARLLMAADGTKSLDDLVALADMDERDALALLFGLMELKILEPRRQPASRRIVLV